jgi:ketosteroid isomerase-like protein
VTAELEQLNERWLRAWLEKDAAAVERLMADDYVYVAPTGQTLDRAAILGVIRSPGYRLHCWARTHVVVRMLGDSAAVIRHRGQGEGEFEGKPFQEDHTCVAVWARVGSQWQVVMEQCTANKA